MDGSQMQQPLISSDQLDIPSLHLLPPSLIPPHSVSHSANAAPISSPPRTTTPTAPTAPTAPSCLGILPDSDKCNGSQFVQDLQQMRIKCCLSSMEDEVHGEVVPKNVLQGDSGFESHVDISQGICGIKTKPTESFDFEFLVGQDHIGLYGLNQVSIDPDIDKL
nr:hypothetical protein CFP56_68270 [Quercus suber]